MEKENLLSLFDGIEVDNTQRISDGDRAVCGMHQKMFEKSLAQIRFWQELLQKAFGEEANPMYEFNRYNGVSRNFSYAEHATEDCYRDLEFTPAYGIVACSKLLLNLCERFENQILAHFRKTYGCSFDSAHAIARALFGDMLDCTRSEYNGKWSQPSIRTPREGAALPATDTAAPSYELIIDYMVESLGGMSFEEREKKEILDRLRESIGWRTVTRTGKKVKISDMADKLWGDEERFSSFRTCADVHTVLEAAKTHFNSPSDATFNERAEWYGTDYPVYKSEITCFKVFKNRAIEFTFDDTAKAESFLGLCQKAKEQYKQKR